MSDALQGRENAALRLQVLVAEAVKHPDNQKGSELWAEVLDVEPEDTSTLYQLYSEVLGLPAQIRDQVALLPDSENKSWLLRDLNRIEQQLARGLTTNAKAHKSLMNDRARAGLEALADAFRRHGALDSSESMDQINEIHEVISQLFEQIYKGNLESDLKRLLLKHLQWMESALRRFRIDGISALDEVVSQIVGDLVRIRVQDPSLWERLKNSDLREKTWAVVIRVGQLVSVVKGATTALDWAKNALALLTSEGPGGP